MNADEANLIDDQDSEVDGNRLVGGKARDVVEYMAKNLVEESEAVDVQLSEEDSDSAVVSIYAAPGDIGRLIGRRGRVIRAIRQIASAAAAMEDAEVTVDVVE